MVVFQDFNGKVLVEANGPSRIVLLHTFSLRKPWKIVVQVPNPIDGEGFSHPLGSLWLTGCMLLLPPWCSYDKKIYQPCFKAFSYTINKS